MDCSCQEEAKYPKLLLNYLYLRREKIPDQQLLAMTLEEFNNREIDLEEEYDHVQSRSKYVLEERQGRDLLMQLDRGVPAADLVLNDGGVDATDPGQGEHEDNEEGVDTSDQGAAAASTDESWRPSDSEEPPSPSSRPTTQNRDRLNLVSLVKIHHGISLRATAELLTAHELQKAMEKGNFHESMIVDHHKVTRECKRTAKLIVGLRNEELAADFAGGLFFDSKEEETLVPKDVTVDGGRSTVHRKEDHYVLLEEPESRFICHFAAKSPTDSSEARKAELVAKQLLQELRDRGVDTGKITTAGGDGCPLNTGCGGGIMIWLEKELGWRLNWIVCLIHTNELGPRHLIADLDGGTSSGSAFRGPIGLLLPSVENLERDPTFEPIVIGDDLVELTGEAERNLSTDFKHLRLLVKSIRTGRIHPSLWDVILGRLCHSRWYTTMNRFYSILFLALVCYHMHFTGSVCSTCPNTSTCLMTSPRLC